MAPIAELQGSEILGVSGDEEGVVFERGSGRLFRSGETLAPYEDEKFILATTEKSDGIEI